MAAYDVLPSTNLTDSDIRDTLRAGGGVVDFDSRSWYKPEANINPFSLRKPYCDYLRNANDATTYNNHMIKVAYRIGDALPASFKYQSILPIGSNESGKESPQRSADFKGYNRNEIAAVVDLSPIPDQVDYDEYGASFPIAFSTSGLWQYLVAGQGAYFDNGVLLIITSGSETRYFVNKTNNFSEWRVTFGFGGNKTLGAIFRSINIQNYTCHLIAIAVPYSHPDKVTGWHEVTPSQNYTYLCYPEFPYQGKVQFPFKKNFRITRPKARCFWDVTIIDNGNGRDRYVPLDMVFSGYLAKTGTGVFQDLWIESGGIKWEDWSIQAGVHDGTGGTGASGDFIYENTPVTALEGVLTFPYLYLGDWVKPEITSNGAVVQDDPDRRIVILRWNIGIKETASLNVGLSYYDRMGEGRE